MIVTVKYNFWLTCAQSSKSSEYNFVCWSIKVNKNDLIAEVSSVTDFTKADSQKAVDAVLDVISSALSSGDEVRLVNFGTFLVVKRKATEGRNPRTGETIKIPASKQPKFRAGKQLKEAVN